MSVLAALAAAAALALVTGPSTPARRLRRLTRLDGVGAAVGAATSGGSGRDGSTFAATVRWRRAGVRRWRAVTRAQVVVGLLAGLGAAGALLAAGGTGPHLLLAVLVGVVVAVGMSWMESGEVVAARERSIAELPLFVDLLVAAVRAGAPVVTGLHSAAAALPGPLAERISPTLAEAEVSDDPAGVWAGRSTDPVVGPLARVVAAAVGRGVSPVPALERVAVDARTTARWRAEARASSLGARAAAPLGLCFLPAFILVGIVPMIAATATDLLP